MHENTTTQRLPDGPRIATSLRPRSRRPRHSPDQPPRRGVASVSRSKDYRQDCECNRKRPRSAGDTRTRRISVIVAAPILDQGGPKRPSRANLVTRNSCQSEIRIMVLRTCRRRSKHAGPVGRVDAVFVSSSEGACRPVQRAYLWNQPTRNGTPPLLTHRDYHLDLGQIPFATLFLVLLMA
jgi:hypothetical protein